MKIQRALLGLFLGLILQAPSIAQGLLERLQSESSGAAAPAQAQVGPVSIALSLHRDPSDAPDLIWAVVELSHEPHWHTYWKNPGDSGRPTELRFSLDGQPLSVIQRAWPSPRRIAVGPLASYGFEGVAYLGAQVRLPKGVRDASNRLVLQANWLICKDICIPGEVTLSRPLVLTGGPSDSEIWSRFKGGLPHPASMRAAGFSLDESAKRLRLWADAPAIDRGGYMFAEVEGLINPSAPQRLYRTASGWLLEMSLADHPSAGLRALGGSQTLSALWRLSEFGPESPGLALAFRSGAPPPQALELISEGVTAQQASANVPAGAGTSASSLGLALGFAFLGGLVLNLMPCVFPVLGLKVLSLTQHRALGGGAWRAALFFTLGVLVSMCALAGLLLLLRSAGQAIGWGFQLQDPWVVGALALLFVAIALNLLGVFEVGMSLTRLGSLDRGEGPLAAFGSGALAVVVASPCTAPFMGSALGFALTAPLLQTFLVFLVLGLGLATPFVFLSLWPAALARLPRPGPWMQTFRMLLAFPMLATVAWLVWVLAEQNGSASVLPLLLSCLALALALLLWGRFVQPSLSDSRSARAAWISILVLLVLVAAGLRSAAQTSAAQISAAPLTTQSGSATLSDEAVWKQWAPGLAEQAAARGQVVFVDFTAAWCISCQVNKARVLRTQPVAGLLANPKALALRADWTREDPEITRALSGFGRSGVPLYVVYPAGGGTPIVLSEWLSSSEVVDALRSAGLR